MRERIQELRKRKEKVRLGGGVKASEKLHAKGKLTARERVEYLLDPDTFREIDTLVTHQCAHFGMDKVEIPGEAVITGTGKINGRQVFFYSQDYENYRGTTSEMHLKKICKVMEYALKYGAPMIGLNDSAGARLQEVGEVQAGFGELLHLNTILSGVVPQISVVFTVIGGQAYSPGLTDFIILNKESFMCIAGPAFVKTQTSEEATSEELGSPKMLAEISGAADLVAESDKESLLKVRELLGYLPSSNRENPPRIDNHDDPQWMDEELEKIVPVDSKVPFDMHKVIVRLVDGGRFFEIKAKYARNVITGFARLKGYAVGVVASQPAYMSGCFDIKASEKAARFVSFCDAFNVPLVFLQDSPGYLIGTESERAGILFRGTKIMHALSTATVPVVTAIIRKANGGTYLALGSKHLGADQVFVWPNAQFGVTAETAASVIFRKEIEQSANPQEVLQRRMKEYHDLFNTPYYAASKQYFDDVIEPKETRSALISALEMALSKKVERPWKKHGVFPM